MYYRGFDKIKRQISLLGFGCMRFPLNGEGKIDREKATAMLDHAYRCGVNYFDTAHPYHNGESEEFMGEYLSKYDRETYNIATKLPCWQVESVEGAKRIFAQQLEKLKCGYVDFYLLHSLSGAKFEKMVTLGVLEQLEEYKRRGLIKYLGFSFHDSYEAFEKIINYKDWDFCQLQLNYMDTDIQAGLRGYELAQSRSTPVIVMEPIKGGTLASVPDEISRLFAEKASSTAPSLAIRWAGSLDGVLTVLSGMSTMEQVEENVSTFADFKPLDDTEHAVIDEAKRMFLSRVKNGCTGCGYCMPCPQGVNIPSSFALWNKYGMFDNKAATKSKWQNDTDESTKPKNCIACGRCEALCPQKIKITDDLKRLEAELDRL